jgi:biotin carboxyl carrier protein
MRPEIEEKLNDLIAFAEENGLSEVTWSEGDVSISFRRGPAVVETKNGSTNGTTSVVEEAPAPEPKLDYVKSPMVGTFRRASGKDRPPMVLDGDHVKPGDRLGIVESMKIPTEVISVVGGVIQKILAEEGQPVEYGQPLFAIRSEE